jgi:hypothetical protein
MSPLTIMMPGIIDQNLKRIGVDNSNCKRRIYTNGECII